MAARLKYNAEWYLPNNTLSRTVSDKTIRAEYTRLRDIAQKRIKRLGESEFSDTEIYRKYRGGFPKLADIANRTNLAYKLAELSRFVSAQTTTVSGLRQQRARSLKTLQQHGYSFVNMKNYTQFGKFMEGYREKISAKSQRPSDVIVELYFQTERLGLDPAAVERDFNFYLNNLETMKEIEPIRGKTAGSSAAIRQKIRRKARK